jgi:succinate dehydrogenase / fumarate reductase iron-sulfur subunit
LKAEVRVFCFDPKFGRKPVYKHYQIPYFSRDKVLGSLIYIYKNFDPCLSFRFNCKGQHCGECAITINGKPGLSCAVSMSRDLVLEPLKNLPLAKDLVIQRTEVYQRIVNGLPPIEIKGNKTTGLRAFPQEVIDRAVHFGGCIHCLCCMSVCPIYKKSPEIFIGPPGLLALSANLENIENQKIHEKAILCAECGQCEEVCPRRIPILKAIRKLKGGDA